MSTPRERFNAAIHFRKSNPLAWAENIYDETVIEWVKQGLPIEQITSIEWEMGRGGTQLINWPALKGFKPHTQFGCQNFFGCIAPVDIGPIPRFKQRLLNVTERYSEFLTETGAKARRSRTGEYAWYNMPMFVEFPVRDRATWQEYRKRFNPYDPRRYPKD